LLCPQPRDHRGIRSARSPGSPGAALLPLRTEASQLSKPLLLRHGWQVEAEETVPYAGELFTRWRMIKSLIPVADG